MDSRLIMQLNISDIEIEKGELSDRIPQNCIAFDPYKQGFYIIKGEVKTVTDILIKTGLDNNIEYIKFPKIENILVSDAIDDFIPYFIRIDEAKYLWEILKKRLRIKYGLKNIEGTNIEMEQKHHFKILPELRKSLKTLLVSNEGKVMIIGNGKNHLIQLLLIQLFISKSNVEFWSKSAIEGQIVNINISLPIKETIQKEHMKNYIQNFYYEAFYGQNLGDRLYLFGSYGFARLSNNLGEAKNILHKILEKLVDDSAYNDYEKWDEIIRLEEEVKQQKKNIYIQIETYYTASKIKYYQKYYADFLFRIFSLAEQIFVLAIKDVFMAETGIDLLKTRESINELWKKYCTENPNSELVKNVSKGERGEYQKFHIRYDSYNVLSYYVRTKVLKDGGFDLLLLLGGGINILSEIRNTTAHTLEGVEANMVENAIQQFVNGYYAQYRKKLEESVEMAISDTNRELDRLYKLKKEANEIKGLYLPLDDIMLIVNRIESGIDNIESPIREIENQYKEELKANEKNSEEVKKEIKNKYEPTLNEYYSKKTKLNNAKGQAIILRSLYNKNSIQEVINDIDSQIEDQDGIKREKENELYEIKGRKESDWITEYRKKHSLKEVHKEIAREYHFTNFFFCVVDNYFAEVNRDKSNITIDTPFGIYDIINQLILHELK